MKIYTFFENLIKNNFVVFILVGVFGILISFRIWQGMFSYVLLPLLVYWTVIGLFLRFSERIFFAAALFCLLLCVPQVLRNDMVLAQKFGVWMYLFLVLGLLQWTYIELFEKEK